MPENWLMTSYPESVFFASAHQKKALSMSFSRNFLFVSTVMAIGLVGCSEGDLGSAAKKTDATTAKKSDSHAATDAHAHSSEGPHHGHLIELGKEEYHAELVHSGDKVTIYLLDASAKKPVTIDAREILVNVTCDGKPEQFKLAAAADTGESEGQVSRFTLASAELVGHLENAADAARLNVTINGTPYSVSLAHSHDDHDHKH